MGFLNLTVNDIILAAVLALVIFLMIKWLWRRYGLSSTKMSENTYIMMQQNGTMAKCKELFPIPEVVFKGARYAMGEKIRIKTLNHKILEGILIGSDDKGRLCVVTNRYVIVHSINQIFEMGLSERK